MTVKETALHMLVGLVVVSIGYTVGMAAAPPPEDAPVAQWHTAPEYGPEMVLKRLVILGEDAEPRIILREIDGHPAIILLRAGETEEKALLDFRAGVASQGRRVLGKD